MSEIAHTFQTPPILQHERAWDWDMRLVAIMERNDVEVEVVGPCCDAIAAHELVVMMGPAKIAQVCGEHSPMTWDLKLQEREYDPSPGL